MARRVADFEAAKIAPPSLQRAVSRPLLLARLAEEPDCAKWLHAPSGSGKSTLAHQYAQGRERKLLWYRLDERDDDPAFFFGAFVQACAARFGTKPALPRFGETDYGREPQFAQRLLRTLVGGLRAPELIVFDDAHRVGTSLHAVLASFVAAAGAELELLFVAETAPPPALFDAIAARRLVVCNDLDLRFDAADCATVARSLRVAADGETLSALTGGHAAALVIACALLRGSPAQQPSPALTAQLHTHLLQKLVGRLPESDRQLLLQTCFLPRITPPLAAAASGREQPLDDLERLADQGLLIRHRTGSDVAYEMHGLVRAGMRAIAAQTLGKDAALALGSQCAGLLERERLLEAAFDLRLELGQVEAACALLEPLGEWYTRRQQPRLLLRALERLPAARVDRLPRASLLAGFAFLALDDALARAAFARAHAGYTLAGDPAGMALAAAGQLIALNIKFDAASGLGDWLRAFHETKAAGVAAVTGYPERGILLLGVLSEAKMGEADATTEAERHAALDELTVAVVDATRWLSPDQQMVAAWVAIKAARVFRTFDASKQVARLTLPLTRSAEVSPLQRGRWWHSVGLTHCWSDDPAGARACLAQIEILIECGDVQPLRFEAAHLALEIAVRDGDLDAAEATLPTLLGAAQIADDVAMAHELAATLYLRRGRPQQALAAADIALRALRQPGVPRSYARRIEVTHIYALAATGQLALAAKQAHDLANKTFAEYRDWIRALALTFDFLASGATDLGTLSRALRLAKSQRMFDLLQRLPRLGCTVFETALRAGIETEFLVETIRAQRLLPEAGAGAEWPWAVRLRLLGGFSLEVDGRRYQPERKAQQRPLDLLKLLAVHDGAATKSQVVDRLWPEHDEDKALRALDMAVARLRQLLSHEEAVVVADGKLLLGPALVWTDLKSAQMAIWQLRQATTADALGEAAAALTAVYRGELLAGDGEDPWLIGARRRLGQAVVTVAIAAATRPEAAAVPALRELLEHLLALDPTQEEVARALMGLHLARGEPAAALSAYQRCRLALSRLLGTLPSARTEELRSKIDDPGRARTGARAPG